MHKNRQISTNSYIILQNVVNCNRYITYFMFKCSITSIHLHKDACTMNRTSNKSKLSPVKVVAKLNTLNIKVFISRVFNQFSKKCERVFPYTQC